MLFDNSLARAYRVESGTDYERWLVIGLPRKRVLQWLEEMKEHRNATVARLFGLPFPLLVDSHESAWAFVTHEGHPEKDYKTKVGSLGELWRTIQATQGFLMGERVEVEIGLLPSWIKVFEIHKVKGD